MNAELKTLNETLKNMQKNLVAMGEQMEEVVNRIEIISVDKPKFKTEKRDARVGEKVLITNPREGSIAVVGEYFTVSEIGRLGQIDVEEVMVSNNFWAFRLDEYEVIIEPEQAPVIEESPDELTPNEQRAELIEKAKRFVRVEKEVRNTTKGLKSVYISPCDTGFYCDAEYVVNKDKNTVVCLLKTLHGRIVKAKGIAKCMPGEVFNADIGKAIALARALEIDVPQEFLNAVQPDKVVKGMRIRRNFHASSKTYEREIKEVYEDGSMTYLDSGYDFKPGLEDNLTIINDTNAEYSQ